MYTTIQSLHDAVKNRETTFHNQVQFHLQQIKEHNSTNAFIHVFEHEALEAALRLDGLFAKGLLEWKRLTGVCISLKDNICYEGHPSSAGSKILEGYRSPYSATVVKRVLDEGAIIIGMTNCDEFGMGSTSQNSHYGHVRNGINEEFIAGGSSGGAAVSVQIRGCIVALGSDTGGSIRQPAAFTNTIGFKPSYGAISRHGLIAYGSSFDQIGIIGMDYGDIKSVFSVIRGIDAADSTTIDIDAITDEMSKSNKRQKLAYIPEMFVGKGEWMEGNMSSLEFLGSKFDLIPFDFGYLKYLVPTYYILSTAEASSNLARYDGVRYGYRSKEISNLQDLYVKSRTEGFGKEVRKRIMIGTFVLSEGYFDAYFTKAQKIRNLLLTKINEILEEADGLVLPISTSGPWKLSDKITDPTQIYLSDIYTVLANLVGMPAITLPFKQIKDNHGLHLSLQIIGKKKRDYSLFNLAQKSHE